MSLPGVGVIGTGIMGEPMARNLLRARYTALVAQLLAANQAVNEGREGTQALVKTLERLAGQE